MSGRFGTDWPETRTVRRQIEEVTQQIETEKQEAVAKASRQYQASREQYAMLKEQLEGERRIANKLDQDLVQYNTLKQAAETNRELYDSVLQRFKELSVATGLKASNVRVLDHAGIPDQVDFPHIPYFAVVSVLLGLGLGVAGASLVESLDSSLRTPDDLASALELNCLGVIPQIEFSRTTGPAGSQPADPDAAMTRFRQLTGSPGWEAYRSLRTAIVYSTLQPPPRSIMVTSPLASDGKTFTSVNLAMALAQLGARVALVDLNLRDPGIATMFGWKDSVLGMSSYLTKDIGGSISDYVLETEIPNLSVIPAGRVPPNPPELIGSDRMFAALDELKEGFDVVLVDTPPVLEYTDAAVLSPMIDQAILVVRGGVSPRRAAQVCASQLRDVRANLLGAVINAVDMKDPDHAYRPGRNGARAGRRSPVGASS
jgi:capsular exopolysaccharide synthesis family protein